MLLRIAVSIAIFLTATPVFALTAEEWLAKARTMDPDRVSKDMLERLVKYSHDQNLSDNIREQATRLMSRFATDDDGITFNMLLELGEDPSPLVRGRALAALVPLSNSNRRALAFVTARLRTETSAEALALFADRLVPSVSLDNATIRSYFDALSLRQSRFDAEGAHRIDRALTILIRRNSTLRRHLLARALNPLSFQDRLLGRGRERETAQRLLRLVYSQVVVPEMGALDSPSTVRVPNPSRGPKDLPYREVPAESLEIRSLLSEHASTFRAQPDSAEARLAALISHYVANPPVPCARPRLDETTQLLSLTPRVPR